MKRIFLVSILLVLAACATDSRMRDVDRLALYQAHAGQPVTSFRYVGRLSGWTPLGDSALAVWTRPNQAYLLTFNGSCPDLDFASAISVSSQFNTVYSRFDKVMVISPGTITLPCYIREIRPLDTGSIRDAERERRANAQVAQRST